jgi:plasmid maintenance system antidote protein VapI
MAKKKDTIDELPDINRRILEVIELKTGGNKAKFAATIGVRQHNVSALFSKDSNTKKYINPSTELINSILNTYPDIDKYWLLHGEGEMIRDPNLINADITVFNANNASSQRLQKLIKYYGGSAGAFAQKIESKTKHQINNVFAGNRSFLDELAIKIVDAYPNVTYKWRLTGEGEMLLRDNEVNISIGAEIEKLQIENKILKEKLESNQLLINEKEKRLVEKDERISDYKKTISYLERTVEELKNKHHIIPTTHNVYEKNVVEGISKQ